MISLFDNAMRKPLAYRPLKNRPGLTPVGLDAIVLRSLRLFCEFKKVIDCLIKIFFWFHIDWHCRAIMEFLKCKLFIPVCLACSLTIMIQSPSEATYTERGQGVFKYFSSGLYGDNGVSNLFFDFLRFDINNDFRVNTFQFGINYFFKSFRCFEIISSCDAEQNNDKSSESRNNPNTQWWNREVYAEEFFHGIFQAVILGLIIGALIPLPNEQKRTDYFINKMKEQKQKNNERQ